MTKERREDFTLAILNPHMVGPVAELMDACRAAPFTIGEAKYVFHPFEGFRHPSRQYDLFRGGKVTKAGPWESAHQYGLAVDFACVQVDGVQLVPNSWCWPEDAPWGKLKRLARSVGLDVPIAWDRGHVEHPMWQELRACMPK